MLNAINTTHPTSITPITAHISVAIKPLLLIYGNVNRINGTNEKNIPESAARINGKTGTLTDLQGTHARRQTKGAPAKLYLNT